MNGLVEKKQPDITQRRLERQFKRKYTAFADDYSSLLSLSCTARDVCAVRPCSCAWQQFQIKAHRNFQCDYCHQIPIGRLYFCVECTAPPDAYIMCEDCAEIYRHPCRDPMHCVETPMGKNQFEFCCRMLRNEMNNNNNNNNNNTSAARADPDETLKRKFTQFIIWLRDGLLVTGV